MNERLSRRDFLRMGIGAGLAAGAAFTIGTRLEGHENPPNFIEPLEYLQPPRTIEKMQKLSLTAANAQQELLGTYPLITNLKDVRAFRDEFVPYFALIGYTAHKTLVYPDIRTEDFGDDRGIDGDFFLLGYSSCVNLPASQWNPEPVVGDDSIALNERYFAPYSEMQRPEKNPMLVATISHEIAHSNDLSCLPQVAFFGDYNMVEGTTQIVSTNALAAMSQDSTPIALPAFLEQIKNMSRGWVLKELNDQNRTDEYDDFLGQFPNHSEMQGRWRLASRAKRQMGFVNSARDYAWKPMEVLSEAMADPNSRTAELKALEGRTLDVYQTWEVLGNLSHYVSDRIK